MRVVALVSGGKDSCYCMQLCKHHGHDIVALANLLPEDSALDELDSFCFQTVGHQLIEAYAQCMGIPLFRKRISGTSSVQDLGYSPTEGDEVEDLYQLLAFVKEHIPGVQAVASGAIASDYQRLRVENVCSRLNLVSLAYLWHQPQRLLLRGMVESGVEAILVKVACLGLHPRKHLGRTIAAMEPVLISLADAYGCNVCGEGGEYETLTMDCPVFSRGHISLDEFEIVLGTSDVGHLVPKTFRVLPKPGWEGCELPSDVRHVPADYVAAPRSATGRCIAPPSPLPQCALSATAGGVASTVANCIAAAAGGPAGTATAAPSGAPSAATSMDALLQPVAPSSFRVQVSLCSGPDYVQLVCRAVRLRSALPSDLTECDTTAALHALLSTAEQELAAQRMDLHHCLFVHLFLANMGHFQAANGVYCKHFPNRDPPARACVQVCLPHDCPVMCEFLLARGAAPPTASAVSESRSPLPSRPLHLLPSPSPGPLSPVSRHTRRVLHVQSISAWAPSCIGPYSQATSYRGLVYLAGVIPLDPPVMTLVPGDVTAQVLRAMMSCEAVAVAQRTTVVGAALGLTVYLAAAVGGGGLAAGGGNGPGGGAVTTPSADRHASNGGGAELRALTRSAVEALLEHGLPVYPGYSQCRFGSVAGTCMTSSGQGSGYDGVRYHRSFTCDSGTSGPATPGSSHNTWPGAPASGVGGYGRASAPPSRRRMLLGADGMDEEEEEREEAAGGRLTGSGYIFGGSQSAAPVVLDSYLQPPEVRVSVRPSVLYVTVPSLPRGSLVEIQPVCLDVEALAVIRKLAGHESFIKRRTYSHYDAASLNQSSSNHNISHHGGIPVAQTPSASSSGYQVPPATVSALYSSPNGAVAVSAMGFTTSWSELPPTPRASFESLPSRDGGSGGGGGASHNNVNFIKHNHNGPGSSPLHWHPSADLIAMAALTSPLPQHVISAAGFMSPDGGSSLAGTPSAGPSMLSRQRSSCIVSQAFNGGAGNLPFSAGSGGGWGGGSSIFNRSVSPQPPQLGAMVPSAAGVGPYTQAPVIAGLLLPQLPGVLLPPQPPLSVHNSGHQLLSPTLQHLMQQTAADAAQAQQVQQLMARSAPGGAGSRSQRRNSSNGATLSKESLPTPMAARTSYSGSSGSGSQSGQGHMAHRNSFDGNILSFEVCTGRGGTAVLLSPQPHSANAALVSEADAALGVCNNGGGGERGGMMRVRPAAIAVPQPAVSDVAIQRSPFEGVVSHVVSCVADGSVLGPSAVLSVSEPLPEAAAALLAAGEATPPPSSAAPLLPTVHHAPPALTIPQLNSGSNFTPTPIATALPSELRSVPNGPAAPGRPTAASGPSSSSDVMVTTVCCYGQVLRSLFHLPPAVFTPGVTTAQLTRRFRRAAASVLAAHGMEMSCLIWIRVWYEKGSVEFTDDEYGTAASAPSLGTASGAAAAVATGHHLMTGAAITSSADYGGGWIGGGGPRVLHALDDEGGDISSGSQGTGHRRASGCNDSSSSGDAVDPAALALGAGHSGLGSPQQFCVPQNVGGAEDDLEAVGNLRAFTAAGSPASTSTASPSGQPRRLSNLQPDTFAPDDRQDQSNHVHQHHHHHHSHHGQGSSDHHHHTDREGLVANGTNLHAHTQSQQSQQQHFHVSWVPVQRVATNASPQPAQCVAVLELLAALPTS